MTVQIGVALWSMRATAATPAGWPARYADLAADARFAEQLGYDSLWVGEHRFWYDGWCPQPLVAAAAALGATTRLRVGSAMHLLPQHDADRSAAAATTIARLCGDRLDVGVGLGYRDEEYDGLGLERRRRGRRMEAALDTLVAGCRAPIWIGGMAWAAIGRAVRRGLSLLLPPTLTPAEIRTTVARARAEAAAAGTTLGRVGILKDTWLVRHGEPERRRFLAVTDAHYREYAGSWWVLRGRRGFDRPDLLDAQMRRTVDTAVTGSADEIIERLHELLDAGVDTLGLTVTGDATRSGYREMMAALAEQVLPAVRAGKGPVR